MNDHSHLSQCNIPMRTANLQHQTDRRAAILDAAERCFSQSGFHQTSMSDICQAAAMSPGNLYRYFPSKEAIIEGIVGRHRAQASADFDAIENAPSFWDSITAMARVCLVERSAEEMNLGMEIIAECRRNPSIAKLLVDFEADVKVRLVKLLRTAAERGEINRLVDFESTAAMLMVLVDGISLRRVADRSFDVERALPLVFQMVETLLGKPVAHSDVKR